MNEIVKKVACTIFLVDSISLSSAIPVRGTGEEFWLILEVR